MFYRFAKYFSVFPVSSVLILVIPYVISSHRPATLRKVYLFNDSAVDEQTITSSRRKHHYMDDDLGFASPAPEETKTLNEGAIEVDSWNHLDRPWEVDHDQEEERPSLMDRIRPIRHSIGRAFVNRVRRIKCAHKNFMFIMRRAANCPTSRKRNMKGHGSRIIKLYV